MNRRIGIAQCNTTNTVGARNSSIVQLGQAIDSKQFFAGIENAGILDQNLLRRSRVGVNQTLHVDEQTVALFTG